MGQLLDCLGHALGHGTERLAELFRDLPHDRGCLRPDEVGVQGASTGLHRDDSPAGAKAGQAMPVDEALDEDLTSGSTSTGGEPRGPVWTRDGWTAPHGVGSDGPVIESSADLSEDVVGAHG
ncbi:hypothetical protein [Streptomyces anandii]|uniref:hypothetical protein n=1 Tax=Streptomyces anandii TaxID=285454 RepID=UPI003795ED26